MGLISDNIQQGGLNSMRSLINESDIQMTPLYNSIFSQTLRDSFARIYRYSEPTRGVNYFPIDISKDEAGLTVKASLPGFKGKDINLSVEENTLNIKGATEQAKNPEKEEYLIRERGFGNFSRTLAMPASLDCQSAKADFEDGVLTIKIPIGKERKQKQIEIKHPGKENRIS